jgi:hypothetical protein
MAEDIIQPLNPGAMPADQMVTPAAPEAAPAAPEAPPGTPGLPEDVLRIPAMQMLVAGQPAAVSANLSDFQKRPEAKVIAANKDGLMKAGIGTYRSLGGDLGVMFNRFYISGEELQAADKAGQLQQIAPPFDAVNTSAQKAGLNSPVFNHQGPQGEFKGAPVPEVPQAATTLPQAPASAQRKALNAKITNAQPGGPLSQPAPGSGGLLRSILKPVL